MKISKILYSPIFPVLLASVLLIIGIYYEDFISKNYNIGNSTITSSFEPDVYDATVIHVGGIGSDIYTNRAYYIGDGSGIGQEGWPVYLNKDVYAGVSFNTPFFLMTLSCKDGYYATLMPNQTSDIKTYKDTEDTFTAVIEEKVKNQISIQCEKPIPHIKKMIIAEECERIVKSGLERSASRVDSNKTVIEIVKNNCLWISDSSFTTDFDGDGTKEVVLVTVGAGCVSCHAQEIHIIKDDKVIFYQDGSDFIIKQEKDFVGFTLQHPVTSLPPDPGDEYVIESYKAKIGADGIDGFDKISEERKQYDFK
ncbi:MAG: hypothetical protein AAB614_02820 [Patescibacteria group bacterium]